MRTDERVTPGLSKVLQKSKHLEPCPGCGFPMPVYPGRYPSKCPVCSMSRAARTDEAVRREWRAWPKGTSSERSNPKVVVVTASSRSQAIANVKHEQPAFNLKTWHIDTFV